MKIPFTISPLLAFHLINKHEIDPKDYKPAYGGESVGLDLYYAGNKTFKVNTEEKILIPTGVRVAIPKGYVGLVKDRGSISKTKYVRRAGVIDPGYTGQVFVNLLGQGDIEPGEKLPAQLVVVKAETDYEFISNELFTKLTEKAERGEGTLGSSD